MAPKLYMTALSPPVRAVLMTGKALDIKLELIETNLANGDHKKPEYVKLNPQHTVPLLVDDNGTAVWDSHAIMAYLVGKYGSDDSLYPKDLAKRALVDQRMHYDSGNVFAMLRAIIHPRLYKGIKTTPEWPKEQSITSYEMLNSFLEGKQYMCGNDITIADFSLITSVTSLAYLVPIDSKLTNLLAWIERMEALPYYNANKEGLEAFNEFVKGISA